jgi:hypothetical protein
MLEIQTKDTINSVKNAVAGRDDITKIIFNAANVVNNVPSISNQVVKTRLPLRLNNKMSCVIRQLRLARSSHMK